MNETRDLWDVATVLIGGIGTLAIFSFLIKENPLYRFFEHLFIGISAGLGTVYTLKNFLWPNVLRPLFGLDIVHYPDGTLSHPYDSRLLLYLIPLLFGLLYYFIYSRKYSWLARLVIGFTLGMSGGAAFEGFFNEMMPQIWKSFRPLLVRDPAGGLWLWKSLENCIFLFTLLSVMYYFFFSFRRSEGGVGQKFAYAGRWLMMICFGAFFGSTVMARMALLVERLQFLYGDWYTAVRYLIGV